jgi:2-polyprenyl-3-methyl-5-hydroxy-6-metoxy-1,4-benzoquinol methylase
VPGDLIRNNRSRPPRCHQSPNEAARSTAGWADRWKLRFLLPELVAGERVLDLGCGGMWLTRILRSRGFDCTGIDLHPPADIVGNIKEHRFPAGSFDVVIALEMLEHEDCTEEIRRILRPGGKLIVSTPSPSWDWALWLGEKVGVCQPRSSPHSNLFWLENLPFRLVRRGSLLGVVQLGVYLNEEPAQAAR